MAQYIAHPLPVDEGAPFPIANIPFGIFSAPGKPTPRTATAIGRYVIDLYSLAKRGHLQLGPPYDAKYVFSQVNLNALAALPREERMSVRRQVQSMIRDEDSPLYQQEQSEHLHEAISVTMHMPMSIGGFSDYMLSLNHVTNAGRIIGQVEVPPSFFHTPPAYNGRSSSIVVSGTPIRRPRGLIEGENGVPMFTASRKLDYEVELGVFVSEPVPMGEILPASEAKGHIFGFVMINDWSARDIQAYEMVPLGPFNGKAFGTSISPWVVTLEALEEVGAVKPVNLDGLRGGKASRMPFYTAQHDIEIELSAYLCRAGRTRIMSKNNLASSMHWSPFQMLAHHSSAGCGLNTGDLIGTGTLSCLEEIDRKTKDQVGTLGCLLEITEGGKKPKYVDKDLQALTWLEDEDEVTMEGWAGSPGNMIGFGTVTGRIVPTD